LRIAIADLAGELSLEDVQEELTRVAEAVLREALSGARDEVTTRYAVPPTLKLSVLALGRMGSAEMSFNSDLDLIFIYYLPDEVAASGRECAARLAQKLIAFLEAPTREGLAYKIDLRLRPSGNAGPLVTSLEGFHQYHNQSSALWERQALVRGRVVAGDRTLGDEVEAARQKFVFGRGLDPAGVGEIAAMCGRIEQELGHESPSQLNVKQGSGGLVQVEFIAQMMALRYGLSNPSMGQRSTAALLAAIKECGLAPVEEIQQLRDDHRYLAQLENRLRIESGHAVSNLPTASDELTPIARRMGYHGPEAAAHLLEDLKLRRDRIRSAFASFIAREQAG
jgi:glutamate-ammonia-ligase adenylyltransferase